METRIQSQCPGRTDSPEFAIVVDWLATNGIDEMIPSSPTFLVNGSQIVYRAFKFKDEQRGYDPLNILDDGCVDLLTEDRAVPLIEAPDDAIRAAFRVLEEGETNCSYLVETWDPRQVSEYRKRIGSPEVVIRSRHFNLQEDGSRVALTLTAHNGELHISVGPDDEAEKIPGMFVLEGRQLGRFIETLTKLQRQVETGRPWARRSGA